MKHKKQDMSVGELFRHKLENAEVVPGPSVEARLMRTLARKEFLRFNPFRFNIYYAGIVAAALITAGILFVSVTHEGKTGDPRENTDTVNDTVSGYISIPLGKPLSRHENSTVVEKTVQAIHEVAQAMTIDKIIPRENKGNNTELPGIEGNPSGKVILSDASGEKNRLQPKQEGGADLFEASSYSGCAPLKVRFTNKVRSDGTISWTFGDGGSSSLRDPEWIYDVDGEYRVVLNFKGDDGSSSSWSALVTVYPRPKALFETSPPKAVIPDDEIQFLNYSSNGFKYRWNFGDGSVSDLFEPKHKYDRYGKYNLSLVLTSEHGCSDSLTVINAFSGSEYFINLPNAFIPNSLGPTGGFYSMKSDESAEIFHPVFSGVSEYQMRIFSKLGIVIFESNDINIGWDGYFKGQLCNSGVYIWKIRGTYSNGEPFTKMGDVTLLKD